MATSVLERPIAFASWRRRRAVRSRDARFVAAHSSRKACPRRRHVHTDISSSRFVLSSSKKEEKLPFPNAARLSLSATHAASRSASLSWWWKQAAAFAR